MVEVAERDTLVAMTKDIVVAFISHNSLAADVLPGFIERVHESLIKVAAGPDANKVAEPVETTPASTKQEPAVPIRKSITEDYIVCLEDGKRLKVLTRYIKNRHGMTPDQYRGKWGLAKDYPMICPSYARTRSELAHATGLGARRKKVVKLQQVVGATD